MLLPRQAPPVLRSDRSSGAVPGTMGVRPSPSMVKVKWKCKNFQADQDDPSKIESVWTFEVPGMASDWFIADFPCSETP